MFIYSIDSDTVYLKDEHDQMICNKLDNGHVYVNLIRWNHNKNS